VRVSEPAELKATEIRRSLRILIVEDNIDSGDTLSMLLRLEGHEVLLVPSGIIALETGPALRPEVVRCDIGLPGIDGYDVVMNKPKSAAYRAPGATQAAYACESVIDELAEKPGIDPIDLRLKNAAEEGPRRVDGPDREGALR